MSNNNNKNSKPPQQTIPPDSLFRTYQEINTQNQSYENQKTQIFNLLYKEYEKIAALSTQKDMEIVRLRAELSGTKALLDKSQPKEKSIPAT